MQIVPGKYATVVAVAEGRLHTIVANRLQAEYADMALAGLQDFLPRAVALHFG